MTLDDGVELPESPPDEAKPRKIVIPYKPRIHFKPLHNSLKRWKFVVAHRRCGKTVAEVNHLIRAALQNPRKEPLPRYAYIGPSFAQAKDLVWEYIKQYTGPLDGTKLLEGDLKCTLPNGASITLYGGSNAYERMRGLYFDGAVLDEFPMIHPRAFTSVVRPCLADYRGWAIISGTSNGDDHFHALKKKHDKDPDWDIIVIPVNETDALHPDEVEEMKEDMSSEEFAREMMCSFDAPVEGAFYADIINNLQLQNKITGVPHDTGAQVFTWWDLGIDDPTAIWFIQVTGKEVHVIDHLEDRGHGLDYYARCIKGIEEGHEHRKSYTYATHVVPPDIKARELGTGRSRFEILTGLLGDVFVCPGHRVEDGITAARSILPMCWFDYERTSVGVSALKNYHRKANGQPDHNWASHGSDAFRIGSVAFNQVIGYLTSRNVFSFGGRKLRRRIRGV